MNQPLNKQLLQATENRDVIAVRKYIEEGADINIQDRNKRTPIMIATYNRDAEMVNVLIEAGADVNIQDDNRANPFLHAGAMGYLEIIRLLVKAGADTTLTNRYGGVALIPACERGHVEVVQELLTTTDIDVNHINNLGWTALMEAIILSDGGKTHQEIVQLLIDHGADVNIPDHDGVTPLQHAQERGYQEMVEMLVKAGAQ